MAATARHADDRVEALERVVADLAARLAAHEAGCRCRPRRPRAGDVGLVVAIRQAVGGRAFTARDVRAAAQIDPDLAHVLDEQGLDDVRRIGRRLGAIARRGEFGDWRLDQVTRENGGAIWIVAATP